MNIFNGSLHKIRKSLKKSITLKSHIRIICSVVAISLIELLQDFLNSTSGLDPNVEFWRVVLHLTFVATGAVFAITEILSEKRHVMKNKEELVKLEREQFKDL